MLAPSAGCDCQMLAIMIADSIDLASKERTSEPLKTAGH
jgi:hypothetical protein